MSDHRRDIAAAIAAWRAGAPSCAGLTAAAHIPDEEIAELLRRSDPTWAAALEQRYGPRLTPAQEAELAEMLDRLLQGR